MLVEGHKGNDDKFIDYNKLYRDNLKGELTEEEARITLGRFLRFNIGFLVRILTGFILEPYQRIMIKGWLLKNFTLTVAGRGFSKCIDENAIVLTEHGFKSIKDVYVGEKIWADKGLQIIEGRVDNPEENGFEIKTSGGYICRGKIGHKIKYLDINDFVFKWCNIEDLTGEELIPIRHGMNQWGTNNPFDGYDWTKCVGNRITPVNEPSFYYWMGLITGDGCMRGTPSTISIVSEDTEIINAYTDAIKRYMPDSGACIAHRHPDNQKVKTITAYSVSMRKFFTYLGMEENKLAHEKTFPKRLLGADRETICAFLRGLYDTDGNVGLTHEEKRNRWTARVAYVSTSYNLIKNVHTILLNLGITASIDHCHKQDDNYEINGIKCKTRDAWRVTIFDYNSVKIFNQYIGFGIKRKQERVETYLNSVGKNVVYGGGLIDGSGEFLRKKYPPHHFRNSPLKYRLHKSCSLGRLKQLLEYDLLDKEDSIKVKEIIDGGYYFESIKSIIPCKTKTIDIQVANESCYWSDGFINHNSFVASHFAYLYCIFNPGKHVIVVSATFRSSRKIVENIDDWSRRKADGSHPGGALLRQTFEGDLIKKPDMYRIRFKNKSMITALPLGDSNRLRGFRANVVILDEGLLIPQPTIDNVLKPFLFTPSEDEINRKQRIREREDREIKAGRMIEANRMKFKSQNKMIILSSASYSWESLYDLYKSYLKIIYSQDDKMAAQIKDKDDIKAEIIEDLPASYMVHQISWKVANPDLVEASVKEEIESGMYSETTILREYCAQFTSDSDGFFRAIAMQRCTIEDGQEPCVEIVGESGAEYVLGIDQNTSASETADHFAMCVMKIVDKKMSDGKIQKIGLVVHQYAEAGCPLKEHIAYFHYILSRFNIVYIGFDATQGANLGFINICNESEMFKHDKINLRAIPADYGKEDDSEIIKQVQKSYNRASGMIVQPQVFHSHFQRAANEYLQACFDRQHIMFAGKAKAVPHVMSSMLERDVGPILRTHSSFTDKQDEAGNKDEFINQQDMLIDLVKKECALIEVKASQLGNISFDLPSHMKRSTKTRSRIRKDSYSALLLANWCVRIYTESLVREQEKPADNFFAFLV